jgi:mannosyl-3-phosphoglycerate phosphatase
MNVVIFTDLDGTLLDHDGYSHAAAEEALNAVRRHQIPLVITTSKTRREVERLQAALGIRDPFIVENGAAIFFPERYRGFRVTGGRCRPPYTVILLGLGYPEVRRFADRVRGRYRLTGFGDLSAEEVARRSGLSTEAALLAKEREFTEPFVVDDRRRIPDIIREAASAGLTVTSGGRFFHVAGSRQDKGRAVSRCTSIFAENTDEGLITVGLGDSANDRSMLQAVDIPILIPHPDGSFEDIELLNLRRAPHPGSRGWNRAVLEVMNVLKQWARGPSMTALARG